MEITSVSGESRVQEPLRHLMELVEAEYAEMPGLSVTLLQAQRLWAVDRRTCEEVFSRLVRNGALRMTTKGQFVRNRRP
jgi:hypothetical protein